MFILLVLLSPIFMVAENKKLTQIITLPRIIKLTAEGKLIEWSRSTNRANIRRAFPVKPTIVEL